LSRTFVPHICPARKSGAFDRQIPFGRCQQVNFLWIRTLRYGIPRNFTQAGKAKKISRNGKKNHATAKRIVRRQEESCDGKKNRATAKSIAQRQKVSRNGKKNRATAKRIAQRQKNPGTAKTIMPKKKTPQTA